MDATTDPVTGLPVDPKKTGTQYPPFQFQMPDFSQFQQATGMGYNNLFDQMRDAFSMPSRGAGVFMGNTAPRYGKPAPNLTFPTAFQGLLAQFIHGAPGRDGLNKKAPEIAQPVAPRGLLGGR